MTQLVSQETRRAELTCSLYSNFKCFFTQPRYPTARPSGTETKLKPHQMGKTLQPQIAAGALACMDLVCSAGFDQRYAFVAGESASNHRANTKLYM